MKISSCKDVTGSFIYAMVNNHLLNGVASSIRKHPRFYTGLHYRQQKILRQSLIGILDLYRQFVYELHLSSA